MFPRAQRTSLIQSICGRQYAVRPRRGSWIILRLRKLREVFEEVEPARADIDRYGRSESSEWTSVDLSTSILSVLNGAPGKGEFR
jgi:hypothetical protein